MLQVQPAEQIQGPPVNDGFKARLVPDDAEKPVQMVLTAQQAADLAFITGDFAKEVMPTCEEVERLIQFAATVSSMLDDLVAARALMLGERPRKALEGIG